MAELVDVRAAGGLVLRRGIEGDEILLVHRPRYDDWSLPKGKVDPGETDEECALREVEEETGMRCRLGAERDSTRYVDHKGRFKLVRYWHMEVEGGAFMPNDEVDEVRWLPIVEAVALLTYDHDRALVRGDGA
ncbi:NUDIX hydrolase [Iamia sp.]|uniref:NUDIX hydrolase n=1 Tax=Iamia sp. TaxID=2722710 RepID=UPI002C99F8B0|nr:NUDIX hydrolase [Iamia sp.]HXH57143.1 NUDIX hydrolase [Iamia sp.]